MVNQTFQPVVLAGGRGTRFPDIVNSKPKCLLPVGPYPMIWYPIKMLISHGFTDIIVIVMESQKVEIQQALNDRFPPTIKIDYVSLPTGSDLGTADALKHVKEKIKSCVDILLVSCDVVSNVKLYPLLNIFRQHDASLAVQLFRNVHVSGVTVPGPKMKHKPDRDLIGVHPDTQRLLFMASTSDFEENLTFSSHRLRKNGKMVMYSNLVDSHIYAIKRWVIDFLCDDQAIKQNFSTVKGELLPYIVKKQMARPEASLSDKPTSEVVNIKSCDIFQFVASSDCNRKITETSVFNDSLSKSAYNSDQIRCYSVIAPKETFGIRVNNVMGYCVANKQAFSILENIQMEVKEYISSTAVNKSTQFSNISVGDNSVIYEKTSIRGTILGANCKVHEKTRISDSILMNNVTIKELVVIENCIICDGAIIETGSVLKNCLIGPNFNVVGNTVKEKAHLTNDDGLIEID